MGNFEIYDSSGNLKLKANETGIKVYEDAIYDGRIIGAKNFFNLISKFWNDLTEGEKERLCKCLIGEGE